MLRLSLLFALLAAAPVTAPAFAQDQDEFDPATISEVDAIACKLDVPSYNAFAMAIAGEDDLAGKRNWRKVESGNPFMDEYELPSPITVAGSWSTRRIGFTSNAIVAILDLEDPAGIARGEGVENAMDPDPLIDEIVRSGKATRAQVEAEIKFRKFMGERILVDETVPATEESGFGTHSVVARSISNVSTHPGKTLYGCSYRMELLDKDGKPL